MRVLAVEGAAGQGLVEVLEPVSADKIGVVGNGAEISRIGRAAFAFAADPDQSLPEQPAVGGPEMKLADQGRFAQLMELRPHGGIITDRAPIPVEADDIAPAGAGLDRLRRLPGETAAEVEMVRLMTVQGFCHGPVVTIGKPATEGRQILGHRRIAEGAARQRETSDTEIIP